MHKCTLSYLIVMMILVLELQTAVIEAVKSMVKDVVIDIKRIKEKQTSLEAKLINIEKDILQFKTYAMENRAFRNQDNVVSLEKVTEVYATVLPISNYQGFEVFEKKIVGDAYTTLISYNILDLFTCNMYMYFMTSYYIL